MSKGFEFWNDPSFREEVYELAFGDDAINKSYTNEEVLEKLREFSDKALAFDSDALDSDYSPN